MLKITRRSLVTLLAVVLCFLAASPAALALGCGYSASACGGGQLAPAANPTPAAAPSIPASNSAYAAEVVRLVNVERAANGLAPLTMDNNLSAAAAIRAQEINVQFGHTRPNGLSCFSVLQELGISYRAAGENIAIGQPSPAQVVQAWMDSPGHRANILGDYTRIGVGVTAASGSFRGYAWAQFFTR